MTSNCGGKRRTPARNKWDVDQRRTLVILHTNFPGLSTEQRVAIFNVYHRDHLLTRGLHKGLGVKALKEQYGERVRKPQNWAPACAQPSNDREWQRQREIIQKVRTIAAALQIGEAETPSSRSIAARQALAASSAKIPRRRVIRHQQCHVATSSEQPMREAADGARIAETPSTPAIPSTPPQHPSIHPATTKDHSTSKIPLVRSNGPVVLLSPEKHANAQQKLTPVLPQEAHSPPGRLLFRYFNNSTSHLGAKANGVFEGRGFRATSFSFNNCRLPDPPASVSDRLFTDIENHINRNQVASPFISTADNLIWLLSRIALRELYNGKLTGYISIIKSQDLSPEAIYHPKTYHGRLKAAYVFTEGAWHYTGRSEYLVWAEIPQHAVVNTFSVRRLVELVDGTPGLRIALRFDKISRRMRSLEKFILKELQKDEFELTEETIVGFGKLCAFFGLSDPCHVQSLITSLVFGWCFQIRAQTPEMWAKDATLFTEAFISASEKAILRLKYIEQIKLAYLFGVREGQKSTFNLLHEPNREQNVNRLERVAAAIGLASPDEILMAELQNVRHAIYQYAEQDRARLTVQAPLSRGMLESPGTLGQQNSGDVDMAEDSNDDFRMHDGIVYEKDDDSSSDYEDMNGLT
ncbi:hypothetical protein KC343_g6159 [Hortaea werneckii]|uniref:DUF7587 domain-containing protein n=1 Tax=Hortaea werneckii TaxID=91943 RepID=A0A3M7EK33_HORWE|nr:hypothetical protein KC352_g8749 [Hortaea werneckii]KAI7565598.1 hypothetical protein KC317_g6259 [Hortaea werneckii]KAI7612759.1 hypothetical protein KC346_g7664 [Hortaea werneckii]KAI7626979.1 hypothetical protein KC343_g6159 [Hortaea werneckii]KAI7664006.1 hypothetical protein KC319_g7596 [Hortaea werneckii]